jgi:hypothetical protein
MMKPEEENEDAIPSEDIRDTSNLSFNEEADSYELDVKGEDPDYDHPDPYETTAPNGEDDNSDWDEANLYVGDEYKKTGSVETDVDKLGMHIDDGRGIKTDPIDKELGKTDEDLRSDLDAEGYPRNDLPKQD